jgi:hypothetical protein
VSLNSIQVLADDKTLKSSQLEDDKAVSSDIVDSSSLFLTASKEIDALAESSSRKLAHIEILFSSSSSLESSAVNAAADLNWSHQIFSRVDNVLSVLVPSSESVLARKDILKYLKCLVIDTIGPGALTFPIGSFINGLFLPDGDLDITLSLCAPQFERWFVSINEALCMFAMSKENAASGAGVGAGAGVLPGGGGNNFDPRYSSNIFKDKIVVNNVSFINADVKVVKSSINGISVNISANQIGSLYSYLLLEQLDEFIGNGNLFKRSLLLVKSWCRFESPRYTQGAGSITSSRDGRLSSWALSVMLMVIFQGYGRYISHPMQALGFFLQYYATFDWSNYAVTIKGPVSVSDLSSSGNSEKESALQYDFIPNSLVESIRYMHITYLLSSIPLMLLYLYYSQLPH